MGLNGCLVRRMYYLVLSKSLPLGCRESVSPAARELGEKNIKTANITLEMLSKGGYYDMPMSVSASYANTECMCYISRCTR